MPRRAKGPRLYLDPERKQWVIRDGSAFIRTGCPEASTEPAERALGEYIASKYRPAPSAEPSIEEVLEAYLTEKVPDFRTATNTRYCIRALEKWWSGKRLSDINARSCRAYAATRTQAAARMHLKKLKAAVMYWDQEYGPLSRIPKFTLPSEPANRERWLSRTEAAKLLWSARKCEHLKRLILIGLHTGSRPGVVRALEWGWINFETGLMLRKAPGEAERPSKRRTPVKLGPRILSHLRRWKRLDGGKVKWVVHYNGKQIDDPHGSWKRAIKDAGLPGVTPHTLRHTRATWLMMEGVSIWDAAGALGMSPRVLESVYGHFHPDYGKAASEV